MRKLYKYFPVCDLKPTHGSAVLKPQNLGGFRGTQGFTPFMGQDGSTHTEPHHRDEQAH